MWNIIKSRIMLLQSYSKDSSFSYRRTRERHAPILDALRRRDRESFLKSIEDHITFAYRKGEYQIHSG
jgi:DNA-binding GntR family transcriptional regulator